MSTDIRYICRSVTERQSDVPTDLSRNVHAELELAFAEHRSAAKALLLERGFFDDVEVGCTGVAFTGKESHAAIAPELGVATADALAAASVAALDGGLALALTAVAAATDHEQRSRLLANRTEIRAGHVGGTR